MARIQFDITDEELRRFEKYIPNPKYRHGFAHKALMEWINRQEGRDKRIKEQNRKARAAEVQELIDSGEVKIHA
jgi:hypothetical protein